MPGRNDAAERSERCGLRLSGAPLFRYADERDQTVEGGNHDSF